MGMGHWHSHRRHHCHGPGRHGAAPTTAKGAATDPVDAEPLLAATAAATEAAAATATIEAEEARIRTAVEALVNVEFTLFLQLLEELERWMGMREEYRTWVVVYSRALLTAPAPPAPFDAPAASLAPGAVSTTEAPAPTVEILPIDTPEPPSVFFAKLGLSPGYPEGDPYHDAHRGTTKGGVMT